MADRQEELSWSPTGTPVSARFDDPYFSLHDGLAETRHVFLRGNGLPGRFRKGFHIGELGFGTGLNMLAAWAEWERGGLPGPLRFTSFEAYPMAPHDMARALAAFPDLHDWRERFLAAWDGTGCDLGTLLAEVVIGDARVTLPAWQGQADAWFLDGFSPARNPEMWQPELMQAVARHTAPGGTAATYSAAGSVRRGLQAAGFSVFRDPGFGRKRHMTRAILSRAGPVAVRPISP